jgi:hypothetical protein
LSKIRRKADEHERDLKPILPHRHGVNERVARHKANSISILLSPGIFMKTYFVRHTPGISIDDDTRKRLWDERRIAIHFPCGKDGQLKAQDMCSTAPEDYKGGKGSSARGCMSIMVELARDGGYVCAQHHPHEEWMLGQVEPASKIELFEGKWSDGQNKGRTAILKSLRLIKVKLVNPLDHAVLQAGRPRQGTIKHWPSAGTKVENLVENRCTQLTLQDLSTRQQEILCSEFLRLAETETRGLARLAHLALPPGRTLKDIDIIGVATDGKDLLAQVTFASLSNAAWKLDRLKLYRDSRRAHLILFCDCPDQSAQDGITIFPMQKAFTMFAATTLGKICLQLMTSLQPSSSEEV